jgi:hypothetical protein
MRRRPGRRSVVSLSLFPFLAVLVCTMGALIVLLVVVVQQARVHADTVEAALRADQETATQREALVMELEDQAWRSEVLEEQRREIQAQLAAKRLELAHLEDHIRQLEERWKRLQSETRHLVNLRDNEQQEDAQVAEELERLRRELAESRADLAEAERRAAEKPRGFTIIPYPGPHGTERRPIYIECTARGVILRPENIVLTPEDFDGPGGPGNPLDAGLRAIREYHARHLPSHTRSDPYPLLVIRPDGIEAYAFAREAMSAWEDEYGYELVAADLQLNYPPPDPALASLLADTIRDARSRQARLKAAMPANPRGSGFVVSEGRGGVVSLDGHAGGGSRGGVGSGRGGTGTGQGESRGMQSSTSEGGDEDAHEKLSGDAASGNQGQGAADGSQGQGGGPALSLASSRGGDWALEQKNTSATGYRRPVRVICRPDALLLMPEPGSSASPRDFSFHPDSTAAVDQFVQALQKRMKAWGLAPLGGYWRPELRVTVEPGAEPRYELLQQLLHQSGLEVVRDQP